MKKNSAKLVGVVSLGCDKNRVDTEQALTILRDAGYNFTSDPMEAEIIIINTCAFIKNARKESFDTIAEMSEYKKTGKCKKLIVTGCMPQKWLKQMREDFPEVDIFMGINSYDKIVELIEESYKTNKRIISVDDNNREYIVKNRMITTLRHYAYLKIADGCDNYCTFCTIPYIRGSYRSRPIENLVAEAEDLVNSGSTELILVAQDVTKYGSDFSKDGKPQLVKLIKELSKIKRLKWIRLLYCYPELVSDELLLEIKNNDKLCKYLDIPFQHVSDNVLKRMNRHIDNKGIVGLVEKIKKLDKFVAIRTTFMVGFPGETNEDFEMLCDFIKKYPIMHVGFFSYSREEGTPAYDMKDQVDEKTKQKRLVKLVKLQKEVVKQLNKQFVGKTLDVCYEGIDYGKAKFFGRTEYQAPEVDTLVYFDSKVRTDIGAHYNIKINKVKGYDLEGENV